MKQYIFLAATLVLVASAVALAGVHVVGGPDTGGNTIPFWPTKPGMRWQTIWHRTEIDEAGAITRVEFQSDSIPVPSTFTGCNVLLCHTSLSHVTTSYKGNYAGKTPVTVFGGTIVVPPAPFRRWFTLVEPTNFTYNNSDNLLIEINWVSASGGTACPCTVNSNGKAGRVYAYDPKAETGTVTANFDQVGRITIGPVGVEPTSLGRVKSVFK